MKARAEQTKIPGVGLPFSLSLSLSLSLSHTHTHTHLSVPLLDRVQRTLPRQVEHEKYRNRVVAHLRQGSATAPAAASRTNTAPGRQERAAPTGNSNGDGNRDGTIEHDDGGRAEYNPCDLRVSGMQQVCWGVFKLRVCVCVCVCVVWSSEFVK